MEQLGVVALVAAAVLVGNVLQRTSGMGTGLVVSPVFVLAIGPVSGVVLTNLTTVVAAALMTWAMRADIDWRRFVRIAPAIVVGSLPAALLVKVVDVAWLEVIIGTALLLALSSVRLVRRLPDLDAGRTALVTGVAGGFLNTAVGVGGPAMLIYAHAVGWPQRSFAATLQPIFLTMGAVSLATKATVGATAAGGLPPWQLAAAAVATVPFGVVVGGWVASRVTATTARRVAVVLVITGATATLLRGLARIG